MPRRQPVPNARRLRPEHRVQLADLMRLRQYHLDLIAQLDSQVATILQIGYGADIQAEHWELDLEKGELYRVEPNHQPE